MSRTLWREITGDADAPSVPGSITASVVAMGSRTMFGNDAFIQFKFFLSYQTSVFNLLSLSSFSSDEEKLKQELLKMYNSYTNDNLQVYSQNYTKYSRRTLASKFANVLDIMIN